MAEQIASNRYDPIKTAEVMLQRRASYLAINPLSRAESAVVPKTEIPTHVTDEKRGLKNIGIFLAGALVMFGLTKFFEVTPRPPVIPQPTPEPIPTAALIPTETPTSIPTATPFPPTPTAVPPTPEALWEDKPLEEGRFIWINIADRVREYRQDIKDYSNKHDNIDRVVNFSSVMSLLAEEPEMTPSEAYNMSGKYKSPSDKVIDVAAACITENKQLDPQVDCADVMYVADNPSLGKDSTWDNPQWQKTYEHAKRVELGLDTK